MPRWKRNGARCIQAGMQKPEQKAADRRQNYAQRLRIAVRRAHDPLFSLLKSPTEENQNRPPPTPQ